MGGERAETRRIVNMMFNEFCETTGLHGWKYLTRVRVRISSSVNLLSTTILCFGISMPEEDANINRKALHKLLKL